MQRYEVVLDADLLWGLIVSWHLLPNDIPLVQECVRNLLISLLPYMPDISNLMVQRQDAYTLQVPYYA